MNRVPQLLLPSTSLISGATGSGKTTLVLDILQNANWLISPAPKSVYWFYGIEQGNVFESLAKRSRIPIYFQKGMPDFETLSINIVQPKVLVLDDLISEANLDLEKIFLNKTRHMNFLTILLSQNLFHNNRFMRNISLNVHYFFVFPSKRDNRQFSVLARQIDPKNYAFLEDVYRKLSDESPFSYIMLDLHPQSDKRLTVRSDITNPNGATVWLPKSDSAITPAHVSTDDGNGKLRILNGDRDESSTMSLVTLDNAECVRMSVIYKKLLHFLCNQSDKDVKLNIKKNLSDSDVILLQEACMNVLIGGHVRLTKKEYQYLSKRKHIIRQLGGTVSATQKTIKRNRDILLKHYSILPHVIRATLRYLKC